ncbi:MAG: 4-(cytidine 5'-diphospho)-2-C-methyl-D-erythritol kinase, partial [Opitutales bacterium]
RIGYDANRQSGFFSSVSPHLGKILMTSPIVFSPAKINLFLAVTARRSDGFHNLISLVAPVGFGDELQFVLNAEGEIILECDNHDLPSDERNLVIRAIKLFQEETGHRDGWKVRLNKKIPVGGGLGGGSSNAAKTLLALNQMHGYPLPEKHLMRLAAEIGSDCILFLREGPSVIRGRGELTEPVQDVAASRLCGRKVVLFWPPFSISTAWAYSYFDHCGGMCSSASDADDKLCDWLEGNQPLEDLVENDFEAALKRKFPTFQALLGDLRDVFDVRCSVSGSGSACFAFPPDDSIIRDLERTVRLAWGPEAGFESTELL